MGDSKSEVRAHGLTLRQPYATDAAKAATSRRGSGRRYLGIRADFRSPIPDPLLTCYLVVRFRQLLGYLQMLVKDLSVLLRNLL